MKNYIVGAALIASSFVYADESSYHRMYVGADVFGTHKKEKGAAGKNQIDITTNTLLEGLRIGYDYGKPQTFYFGMDSLVSMGQTSIRNRSQYWNPYGDYRVNRLVKKTPFFANIEQRYGYTFQNGNISKATITPFVGIGWYYIRPQFDSGYFSANWFYGAAGIRINQPVCDSFDVGLNLKSTYSFYGRTIWSGYFKESIKKVWGYEIGVPLTFHLGSSNKWDLQLQPYLLKFDVRSSTPIFGTRVQIGYRF